jgi:hypothetical protein
MTVVPKKIILLCKKYHVRLSVKRKNKRVKKTLCVLLKELKKKVKHKKHRFGEGEQVPQEEPVKKSKFKRALGAIKRNPIKSLVIGGVLIGGAVAAAPFLLAAAGVGGAATAATAGATAAATAAGATATAAAGATAAVTGAGALTAAAGSAVTAESALLAAAVASKAADAASKMGQGAKALEATTRSAKFLEQASKAAATAKETLQTGLEKTQEVLAKAQEVKGMIDQAKSLMPPGATSSDEQTAQEGIEKVVENHTIAAGAIESNLNNTSKGITELEEKVRAQQTAIQTQFGKRTKFGQKSNKKPNKMTKEVAMKIIRKLYLKNCK